MWKLMTILFCFHKIGKEEMTEKEGKRTKVEEGSRQVKMAQKKKPKKKRQQ